MKKLAKVVMVCWLVASWVQSEASVSPSPDTTPTPDANTPATESPKPETSAPDTPKPETPTTEPPASGTPKPETPTTEPPAPETPKPETPTPEPPAPETPTPETSAPETPKPETPAPETPKPETPTPQTPAPESPKPETSAPETPKPETAAPETPKPETPKPETPAPETSKPETPKPETPAPETPKPETPKPETPAPETPKPETPAPETPKPDTPAPETPKPETPAPETPKPDTPAPETPKPETPKPETPAPETPKPETPAPETPKPDTPAPETPKPETPKPETSTPDATTSTLKPTPDPCLSNPCPENSVCEQRFESYTCVCRPGLVLQDGICKSGKVFTGDLRINKPFQSAMADTTSKEFQATADEIVSELKKVLGGQEGYITSTVQSLRQGSVVAEVENLYDLSSKITAKEINNAVAEEAKCTTECLFAGATLKDTNPCDAENACDWLTTTCSAPEGVLSCDCKAGYVKTDFTYASCSVCPSGSKAENNECVNCPFGYSGVNCNESYLLAVVVIACVLGGLLLILLIVLIVVCCRKSKKGSGSLAKGSPYVDMDFGNQAVPKIPRANASNKGWEPANLELVESGSTRALVTPSNGMKQYRDQNLSGIAYRTHGQVNPYYQHNEEQQRRY